MRQTLLFALLLAVAAASAGTEFSPSLVAPVDGAALTGGSLALLEWEVGDETLLDGATEWEAFLSLDGGSTYRIRVTPHLEIDRRRVLFAVPALPTRDARLLLRIGDEGGPEEETGFELPATFSIAAGERLALETPLPAAGEGEAARPGDPGVVSWVEWAPRDGRVRRVYAAPPARSAVPQRRWSASRPGVDGMLGKAPVVLDGSLSSASGKRPASHRETAPGPSPAGRPAPRLLGCRQNE